MKRIAITMLAILAYASSASADVLPLDDIGTWTEKKGHCNDPESIKVITKSEFRSYESSCRFVNIYNVEMRKDYRMFNRARLRCNNEGESTFSNMIFFYQQTPGVLEVTEDGVNRVYYKCSGR